MDHKSDLQNEQLLKEKELKREKKDKSFISVDNRKDPLSNFASNFKRHFKTPKSINFWNLFKRKSKPSSLSPDIIGPAKTRLQFGKTEIRQGTPATPHHKTSLSLQHSAREANRESPTSNKPKLRL
jgi:hypothetical protein